MDISLYIENTNGQISYTLKTNKNEESFIFRLNEEEFNFIIDFINPCKKLFLGNVFLRNVF